MLNILSFYEASTLKKCVNGFTLAVFVLGGVLYCYQMGEAINFALAFPSGSMLEVAVWMMHISLRFLTLWMPFIVLISKFYSRNVIVLFIYIVGCLFAIGLSIGATIQNNEYLKPGTVRDEYEKLVVKSISSSSEPPSALLFTQRTVDNEECCGWKGPIDFGTTISINKKVHHDFTFMKDLEKCYGQTWTVYKERGVLKYEHGPNSEDQTPKGCNMFYKELFSRNCLIVFYLGLIVDILGVVFIGICFLLYTLSKDDQSPGLQPDADGVYVYAFPVSISSSSNADADLS